MLVETDKVTWRFAGSYGWNLPKTSKYDMLETELNNESMGESLSWTECAWMMVEIRQRKLLNFQDAIFMGL